MQNNHEEKCGQLSSDDLAVLIVGSLIVAGLIELDQFNEAVELTTKEIDYRKSLGDY